MCVHQKATSRFVGNPSTPSVAFAHIVRMLLATSRHSDRRRCLGRDGRTKDQIKFQKNAKQLLRSDSLNWFLVFCVWPTRKTFSRSKYNSPSTFNSSHSAIATTIVCASVRDNASRAFAQSLSSCASEIVCELRCDSFTVVV